MKYMKYEDHLASSQLDALLKVSYKMLWSCESALYTFVFWTSVQVVL